MSDNTKKTTDLLGHGPEKGLTLNDLAVLTGKDKRIVRKEIENAILSGERIVNLQDGNGYYYSDDPQVWLRYYFQEEARIESLKSKLLPLKADLRNLGLL